MLSVFLGVLNGVVIIGQAYFLASIIYQVAIHHLPLSQLMHSMWLLFSLFAARAVLSWLREIVNFKSAVTVKEFLRKQLLQHMTRAGPVRLSAYQGGALSSVVIEQVEAVHDYFAHYLPQMVLVCILPILILFFVFPKSWLAGLILLFTAPLIPLFMALVGMGAESRSQKQFEQMAKMSGHFLDVLRGLMTLKLFKSSLLQFNRIASISEEYRTRVMGVLRVAFLSSAVLELFSSAAIAILAVYLGLGLLGLAHIGLSGGQIGLQSALFILVLAPEFFLPLRQLGTHYHARAQAIGAAEELRKILAIEVPKARERRFFKSSQSIRICFEGVGFAYGTNTILENFNLSVEPGEHTVLVGESGAGKSTILNLINLFIEPDAGCIRVNGEDLQAIEPESWRKNMAWVGQNTRLFYGTIRENLLLAKPNATNQELHDALEVAYLEDVIRKLPKGLETRVGEQNLGLSQGQIQRVALCRAYLKNAPVLLLDEATANLDRESEEIILTALKTMGRNKTVISATHREKTILSADKIVETVMA